MSLFKVHLCRGMERRVEGKFYFSNFCYKCVCGVNAEVALDYSMYV